MARAERGSGPGIARCPEPGRFAMGGGFPRGSASGWGKRWRYLLLDACHQIATSLESRGWHRGLKEGKWLDLGGEPPGNRTPNPQIKSYPTLSTTDGQRLQRQGFTTQGPRSKWVTNGPLWAAHCDPIVTREGRTGSSSSPSLWTSESVSHSAAFPPGGARRASTLLLGEAS